MIRNGLTHIITYTNPVAKNYEFKGRSGVGWNTGDKLFLDQTIASSTEGQFASQSHDRNNKLNAEHAFQYCHY